MNDDQEMVIKKRDQSEVVLPKTTSKGGRNCLIIHNGACYNWFLWAVFSGTKAPMRALFQHCGVAMDSYTHAQVGAASVLTETGKQPKIDLFHDKTSQQYNLWPPNFCSRSICTRGIK